MDIDNNNTFIAMRRGYGGQGAPFALDQADRQTHLYAVGKSGSGKSTLVRNMILQDIHQGRGVSVIDPHGDLARDLIDHIPPRRIHDVLYFNPADAEHPVGFNLLEGRGGAPHLVTSSVLDALHALWRNSWGPRMEYILAATLSTLVERGGSTLLGVQKLLTHRDYRRHSLRFVRDPSVRAFWLDEFEKYPPRFRQEAIVPIQNKVGRLTSHPILRNILGQVRSTFDPRFIMDERKILLVNLSKGTLGADASNLLGSLLIAGYSLAALSRAGIPEASRVEHTLYIDEFQNFTTDSFSGLLSEARKYRLNLTISHQFTSQLPPPVRDAIFGNVGTIIAFTVGAGDALLLEHEFNGDVGRSQLTELAPFEVYIKGGRRPEERVPFRARTLPPLEIHYGRAEAIMRRTRAQFTRPRLLVERKINRFLAP